MQDQLLLELGPDDNIKDEDGHLQIGEAELPPRLVSAMSKAGLTLGAAESLSGGQIGDRLAAIPGASKVFVGSVVAYDERIKTALLGVPEDLLAEHGAVSEPVARAMAEGARRSLGSDLAVAVTGIAGPGGATPKYPVGTIFMAICDEAGTDARRIRIPGNRGNVRKAASLGALRMAWDRLTERGLADLEDLSEAE